MSKEKPSIKEEYYENKENTFTISTCCFNSTVWAQ